MLVYLLVLIWFCLVLTSQGIFVTSAIFNQGKFLKVENVLNQMLLLCFFWASCALEIVSLFNKVHWIYGRCSALAFTSDSSQAFENSTEFYVVTSVSGRILVLKQNWHMSLEVSTLEQCFSISSLDAAAISNQFVSVIHSFKKLSLTLDVNIWPYFGHIQLESAPVIARADLDKELETQVFRKGIFSGRKLRAAVLKHISTATGSRPLCYKTDIVEEQLEVWVCDK